MFSLTRQERQLVVLVVVALLIGTAVKQWRSAQRMETAAKDLVVETQE